MLSLAKGVDQKSEKLIRKHLLVSLHPHFSFFLRHNSNIAPRLSLTPYHHLSSSTARSKPTNKREDKMIRENRERSPFLTSSLHIHHKRCRPITKNSTHPNSTHLPLPRRNHISVSDPPDLHHSVSTTCAQPHQPVHDIVALIQLPHEQI